MIYVLIAVLLVMLATDFFLNKKSILAPGCITIEVFLIGSIAAAFCIKQDELYTGITIKTVLIILTGILVLCAGEFITNKIIDKNKNASSFEKISNPFNDRRAEYPAWVLLIVIILLMGIVVIKYRKVCEVTETLGIQMPILERLAIMRAIVTSATFNTYGSVIKVCSSFSSAVSWVAAFLFLYNCIKGYFKAKDIGLFVIIILNIFVCILSTGRDFLIAILAGYLLMAYALMLQNSDNKLQISTIFIAISIGAFLAFLLLFVIVGRYKEIELIKYQIFHYVGSPITSLDDYLNRPYVQSQYFGEETLYGVYNVLRKLKIYDTPAHVMQLEYPDKYGICYANIYTSLRRVIQDYGFAGMYIYQFLCGCLYTVIDRLAISHKKLVLSVIAWGFVGYAIVEQAIEERLLTVILGSNTVYVWIVIIGMYLLVRLYNSKKESENEQAENQKTVTFI